MSSVPNSPNLAKRRPSGIAEISPRPMSPQSRDSDVENGTKSERASRKSSRRNSENGENPKDFHRKIVHSVAQFKNYR